MDLLKQSTLWKYCEVQQQQIYFRYDIWPEGDCKENWSIFVDLQDGLRQFGWEIDDVYIEHDCITGYLVKVKQLAVA